ncbi:MAG TPA: glycosyltransferase family 39 protein [Bacteroidia bacterium]
MFPDLKLWSKKDLLILSLIWCIITAININKAFHIDDSFHLEAAEWIAKHPLTPMSGYINWYNNPEEINHFNQPPLLFFLIAAVGEVTGYHEIPLHLIIAFFSFVSLYYFRKLLLLFSTQNTNLLLAIFAFCPAFIVNQNLMTDVPILALELGFMYHLLSSGNENPGKNLFISMLYLGASMLIKYSMIPLIPLTFIALLLRKDFKKLHYLLIPLLMMALWIVWNKLEYNGVHIKDRPKNDFSLKDAFERFKAFLACLGSVLPIAWLLWTGLLKKKFISIFSIATLILFSVFAYSVYIGKIEESKSTELLNILFLIIGSGIVLAILTDWIISIVKAIKKRRFEYNIKQLIILLWVMALTGFLILYAPFMATRHVLLILPGLLLLTAPIIENTSKLSHSLALYSTLFLGIVLGISDWVYADFYRDMAKSFKAKENTKVWSAGHWGWQWYSVKAGMPMYAEDSVKVNDGDYILYPTNISKQDFDSTHQLTVVETYTKPFTPLTFFKVHNFAAMYNSYSHKPSWEFGKQQIGEVILARISIVPIDSSSNQDSTAKQ